MGTEFYRETKRTARKDYRCLGCLTQNIKKGDSYYDVFCIFDGDATGYKLCKMCRDYVNEAPNEFAVEGWHPGQIGDEIREGLNTC